jgi:hypothetical protein
MFTHELWMPVIKTIKMPVSIANNNQGKLNNLCSQFHLHVQKPLPISANTIPNPLQRFFNF